jgi:hypothetical protein
MTKILEVPLSIHEATINRHKLKKGSETKSTPALDRLASAVADLRTKAQRARDLAAAIDADKSFAGQHARQKYSDDAKKLLDAANVRLTEARRLHLANMGDCRKQSRLRR